jgi:hypothetical protein
MPFSTPYLVTAGHAQTPACRASTEPGTCRKPAPAQARNSIHARCKPVRGAEPAQSVPAGTPVPCPPSCPPRCLPCGRVVRRVFFCVGCSLSPLFARAHGPRCDGRGCHRHVLAVRRERHANPLVSAQRPVAHAVDGRRRRRRRRRRASRGDDSCTAQHSTAASEHALCFGWEMAPNVGSPSGFKAGALGF